MHELAGTSIPKAIQVIKRNESKEEKYGRGDCVHYSANIRREGNAMAAGRCDVCERKPLYGNNVPFSQHRTRRRFVLNVHRRRLEIDGTVRNVNICTRCLRTMSKL